MRTIFARFIAQAVSKSAEICIHTWLDAKRQHYVAMDLPGLELSVLLERGGDALSQYMEEHPQVRLTGMQPSIHFTV